MSENLVKKPWWVFFTNAGLCWVLAGALTLAVLLQIPSLVEDVQAGDVELWRYVLGMAPAVLWITLCVISLLWIRRTKTR